MAMLKMPVARAREIHILKDDLATLYVFMAFLTIVKMMKVMMAKANTPISDKT